MIVQLRNFARTASTTTAASDARYDPAGDRHAQNLKMAAALTEKKYHLNYTWGLGTHSNKQGGAIMPGMLRRLWHDYPRPADAMGPRE